MAQDKKLEAKIRKYKATFKLIILLLLKLTTKPDASLKP